MSRLITTRVSVKPMNITIIKVYTPNVITRTNNWKSFFWRDGKGHTEGSQETLDHYTGDLNAKIRLDAYKVGADTVGQYGVGKINDRGLRLLKFASSH